MLNYSAKYPIIILILALTIISACEPCSCSAPPRDTRLAISVVDVDGKELIGTFFKEGDINIYKQLNGLRQGYEIDSMNGAPMVRVNLNFENEDSLTSMYILWRRVGIDTLTYRFGESYVSEVWLNGEPQDLIGEPFYPHIKITKDIDSD
jgi:hypothetical protein